MDDLELSLEEEHAGTDGQGGALEAGAEHLSNFRAPELDPGDTGANRVIPVDQETGERLDDLDAVPEVQQISKDAFFLTFKHGFGLPGMFMPMWRPLAIQPEEFEIARDASDAIYELLEIYFPSALSPQSETFQKIARAAPFILAKVMVVRAILEERRRMIQAERKAAAQTIDHQGAAPKPQEAANNNAPPPGRSPFDWSDQEAAA